MAAAKRAKKDETDRLKGETVVVDTCTTHVYVGTFKEMTDRFLTLTDADVHDVAEGGSSKEMYALETRRHGIQKNRREVLIRNDVIMSLSKLDDVILF